MNGMICHAFHALCEFSIAGVGFSWVLGCTQDSPASTVVSLQYMCQG